VAQRVTVATTYKLKTAPGDWYYKACCVCPRVAKGDQPPCVCGASHNTETESF
ncbi:hypothetical protein RYX36_008137, partial [Vicia faba]